MDKETVSDFIKSAKSFVVASVPVVGKITLLAAVVVMVKSPIPLVTKLLAMVIVLPVLATPVPPFAPGKIPIIEKDESAYLELSDAKA